MYGYSDYSYCILDRREVPEEIELEFLLALALYPEVDPKYIFKEALIGPRTRSRGLVIP